MSIPKAGSILQARVAYRRLVRDLRSAQGSPSQRRTVSDPPHSASRIYTLGLRRCLQAATNRIEPDCTNPLRNSRRRAPLAKKASASVPVLALANTSKLVPINPKVCASSIPNWQQLRIAGENCPYHHLRRIGNEKRALRIPNERSLHNSWEIPLTTDPASIPGASGGK